LIVAVAFLFLVIGGLSEINGHGGEGVSFMLWGGVLAVFGVVAFAL